MKIEEVIPLARQGGKISRSGTSNNWSLAEFQQFMRECEAPDWNSNDYIYIADKRKLPESKLFSHVTIVEAHAMWSSFKAELIVASKYPMPFEQFAYRLGFNELEAYEWLKAPELYV